MYADSLLKNTPTKHSKYVVNQKLKYFDDISIRELLGRIRVFFLTKQNLSRLKTRHLYLRWTIILIWILVLRAE
jgi:hypothetical protein